MQKPNTHQLKVAGKTQLSPRFIRVTLTGDSLVDFPEGRDSANCKLVLSVGPTIEAVRTYTIRSFRSAKLEIDIDFFVHEQPGPASLWATTAAIGEKIVLKGPSQPKLVNSDGDWLLLAGDMSAFPAIEANLEQLSSFAKGYCVLEVTDQYEIRPLDKPDGVDLIWVFNPRPELDESPLPATVRKLTLPKSRGSVWIAGESDSATNLKRYFKDEIGIPKSHLYASGYWRKGLTEDAHQILKRKSAG